MAANGYLKVVDEDEARRLLIVEGKSLRWMVEFYREKYGVKTSHQMWSRLRALWSGMKGHEGHSFDMSTGVPRGVLAVPWTTPLTVENPDLRDALSGLSACYWGLWDKNGGPSDRRYRKLYSFVSRCLIGDLVVDYVSDPYPSFRLVERRSGVDAGWIRNPFLANDGSSAGSPMELAQRLRGEAMLAWLSNCPDDLPHRPFVARRGRLDEELRCAVRRVLAERRPSGLVG